MLKESSPANLVTHQLPLVGNTGGGSFATQLQAALDAINAGATHDACGRLGGCVNDVSAQSGRQRSTELADQLLANAAANRTAARLLIRPMPPSGGGGPPSEPM